MDLKNEKCLVAYFSRKGKNYVSGNIIDLPVGNTEIAAKIIQELTGGDIFHINPVNPYPDDYAETIEAAKREKDDKLRPSISEHVKDMDSYSVIFLGYPNWWNTMPMPVFTFLEEYDFTGKTIIPFCTHEGSGLGNSERDVARTCPKATIGKGLSIIGSHVKSSHADIINWIKKL